MNINDIIQRRRAVYPNQYDNEEIEDSFIKLLLKMLILHQRTSLHNLGF